MVSSKHDGFSMPFLVPFVDLKLYHFRSFIACIITSTKIFKLFSLPVIVISADGDDVRQIMLSAYELGMTNGDYVFISYHPFNNTKTFGDDSWNQVR